MNEMAKAVKQQYEEKITLITEQYAELLKAFENRPSRVEDLALIRQLQEDLEKDEGARKASDNSRGYIDLPKKEQSTSKIFASHPHLNTNSNSVDKPRVNLSLLKRSLTFS